ncbi:Uncharacterized protein APZ42_026699 [Daphnia magna]|uniref:RNA-directed DNA polymerase n=1 Tax=Daphnia magna TaxID=35525 RepID=A0A164S1E1_9CRUS|nr:Uncharacterized protein APZ42_026699 [Daphnia magna]
MATRRTFFRLRDKYYWPTMLRDIKEYCTSSEPYLLKYFLGPIKPHSLQGNNYILVITDYFSKWIEVIPLTNCTTLSTSKALVERIIFYHGPPKAIITDRGSNVAFELLSALCKALNIKRMKTTAYHPQTNGQTERFNKTVVEMIRKYLENGFERWENILGPFVFAYNNSVNSSTLETPYFLNHGRDPVMPIDQFLRPLPPVIVTPSDYKIQIMKRLHEAFQHVKINLYQAREQKKAQYDKRVKEQKLTVGDKVLLDMRTPLAGISKKLIPRFIGPIRIFKLSNNSAVEIQLDVGKPTQLVHVNRIKPLFESMIWKDEPGVDFLDVRIEKQGKKFVQETADELETFPPPLETNLQSELEQISCEKETPTQNLMRPTHNSSYSKFNDKFNNNFVTFQPDSRDVNLTHTTRASPRFTSSESFKTSCQILKLLCLLTFLIIPFFGRLHALNITFCNCTASQPKGLLKLTSDDCDYQISPLHAIPVYYDVYSTLPKSPVLLAIHVPCGWKGNTPILTSGVDKLQVNQECH